MDTQARLDALADAETLWLYAKSQQPDSELGFGMAFDFSYYYSIRGAMAAGPIVVESASDPDYCFVEGKIGARHAFRAVPALRGE